MNKWKAFLKEFPNHYWRYRYRILFEHAAKNPAASSPRQHEESLNSVSAPIAEFRPYYLPQIRQLRLSAFHAVASLDDIEQWAPFARTVLFECEHLEPGKLRRIPNHVRRVMIACPDDAASQLLCTLNDGLESLTILKHRDYERRGEIVLNLVNGPLRLCKALLPSSVTVLDLSGAREVECTDTELILSQLKVLKLPMIFHHDANAFLPALPATLEELQCQQDSIYLKESQRANLFIVLPPNALPPALTSLDLGECYRQPFEAHVLPITLTKLLAPRVDVCELATGVLPPHLVELSLFCTSTLPAHVLPPSLHTLHLNAWCLTTLPIGCLQNLQQLRVLRLCESFEATIAPNVLPAGLTALLFPERGARFDHVFQVNSLPPALEMLALPSGYSKSFVDESTGACVLPVSLRILKLGNSFNEKLSPNILSHTQLHTLRVFAERSLAHALQANCFPNTLTALELHGYNHPLLPHVLPHSLIICGLPSYNHLLVPGVFGPNVTFLMLSAYSHPFHADVLPESLLTLHLYSLSDHAVPLFLAPLPCGLTALSLPFAWGHRTSIARNILPKSLKYFKTNWYLWPRIEPGVISQCAIVNFVSDNARPPFFYTETPPDDLDKDAFAQLPAISLFKLSIGSLPGLLSALHLDITGSQYSNSAPPMTLSPGILPPFLLRLQITVDSPVVIEPMALPNSLTELRLHGLFNQSFEPYVLPSYLRILELHVRECYEHSLYGVLPQRLQELRLNGEFRVPIDRNHFPEHLKIIFGPRFC